MDFYSLLYHVTCCPEAGQTLIWHVRRREGGPFFHCTLNNYNLYTKRGVWREEAGLSDKQTYHTKKQPRTSMKSSLPRNLQVFMWEPRETNTPVGVDVEQHPLTNLCGRSNKHQSHQRSKLLYTVVIWVRVTTRIQQIQCALKFRSVPYDAFQVLVRARTTCRVQCLVSCVSIALDQTVILSQLPGSIHL